jgi:hypothetical protein
VCPGGGSGEQCVLEEVAVNSVLRVNSVSWRREGEQCVLEEGG